MCRVLRVGLIGISKVQGGFLVVKPPCTGAHGDAYGCLGGKNSGFMFFRVVEPRKIVGFFEDIMPKSKV